MQIHELKILPKYFIEVKCRIKNFELRKDDRGFRSGDLIVLREYENGKYTGRKLERYIKYILRDCPEYGLKEGYCILGF